MISIVVPVYNGEKFIERCVNSILKQSCQEWELLLLDNGSKDKSLEICKRLADQDGRIRVFHEEDNLGVSAARNLGMHKARGEYLTFVDADDRVKSDYLEILLRLQKEHQADMVIGGFEKWFGQDNGMAQEDEGAGTCLGWEYTQSDYIGNCLLNGNTHCWGVLYEKKLLEGLYFLEGLTIGEDVLFLLDAAARAEKIVVTDYPAYQYYINSQGAMERPFTPSYMDQIICWQKVYEKLAPIYPEFRTKLESILLVSVLLVVGKLSALERKKRREFQREQEECHRLAKQYGSRKEVRSCLPPGYLLKVRFYTCLPELYMLIYGRVKGKKS